MLEGRSLVCLDVDASCIFECWPLSCLRVDSFVLEPCLETAKDMLRCSTVVFSVFFLGRGVFLFFLKLLQTRVLPSKNSSFLLHGVSGLSIIQVVESFIRPFSAIVFLMVELLLVGFASLAVGHSLVGTCDLVVHDLQFQYRVVHVSFFDGVLGVHPVSIPNGWLAGQRCLLEVKFSLVRIIVNSLLLQGLLDLVDLLDQGLSLGHCLLDQLLLTPQLSRC